MQRVLPPRLLPEPAIDGLTDLFQQAFFPLPAAEAAAPRFAPASERHGSLVWEAVVMPGDTPLIMSLLVTPLTLYETGDTHSHGLPASYRVELGDSLLAGEEPRSHRLLTRIIATQDDIERLLTDGQLRAAIQAAINDRRHGVERSEPDRPAPSLPLTGF